ncbi:hypothetical protein PCE1_002088 [Barthelona sp. PCE]
MSFSIFRTASPDILIPDELEFFTDSSSSEDEGPIGGVIPRSKIPEDFLCEDCESRVAIYHCTDCGNICSKCLAICKEVGHPMPVTYKHICSHDGENAAVKYCLDCSKFYCNYCCDFLHKFPALRHHRIVPSNIVTSGISKEIVCEPVNQEKRASFKISKSVQPDDPAVLHTVSDNGIKSIGLVPSQELRIIWDEQPRRVMILWKETDMVSFKAAMVVGKYLVDRDFNVFIPHESLLPADAAEFGFEFAPEKETVQKTIGPSLSFVGELNISSFIPRATPRKDSVFSKFSQSVDFVITVGGDGVVLSASDLFDQDIPPILPFHIGKRGFLTSFYIDQYATAIELVLTGNFPIFVRTRICGAFRRKGVIEQERYQVLNEIVVDRGQNPYLSNLECFIDSVFFTNVQADGVIFATPSGSTAYSLSAGGSVTHPSTSGVIMTPICPHSLSFRPLLLPESSEMTVRCSPTSRGSVWVAFDGRHRQELLPGDDLLFHISRFPLVCIAQKDSMVDWIRTLQKCQLFSLYKHRAKHELPYIISQFPALVKNPFLQLPDDGMDDVGSEFFISSAEDDSFTMIREPTEALVTTSSDDENAPVQYTIIAEGSNENSPMIDKFLY